MAPYLQSEKNIINNPKLEKKMKKNRLGNQGQGVMEYIIISSLVGIFCLVIIKSYGEVIHQRIEYMKAKIVKNIPAN